MALRTPLAAALVLAFAGVAVAEERLTILNEGDTASLWRPVAETIAMPAYPGVVTDKSEDVCVSVGYLLKEDGSTSDYAVLDAWGSKTDRAKPTDPHFLPFSQNALAAVQRWRFESIAGSSAKLRPVYTSATFGFTTTGAPVEDLKGRCRIADLPSFIKKAQEQAYRRGDLNKGRIDRSRVENPAVLRGTKAP
jgi:hypothetical protein